MTEDRDPFLQALFADAEQDFTAEPFVADVVTRTDKMRRRANAMWLCTGLTVAVIAWLVVTPLQDVLATVVLSFTTPVFAMENPLISELLQPMNSIAGITALIFLTLRFAYRRIRS